MISLEASRGLGSWLRDRNCTVLVSAYQSGLLLVLGSNEEGEVTFTTAAFDRAMGISGDASGFWLATLNRLWRYTVFRLRPGSSGANDAVLVPQTSHHTGYINAHDVAVDRTGRPVVVASQFNCLMRIAADGAVQPIWRAPFVDRLVAEDRCHLNGLTVEVGVPKFATALSSSNLAGSWRGDPSKGCVVDVLNQEVVASGLCMPHSPRSHRGKLWLHTSGTGAFGYLDGRSFEQVAFCPGYPRGLHFLDDIAIVGVSKPRPTPAGTALPLARRLAQAKSEAICGVLFIDVTSGRIVHSIRFGEGIDEIFDVSAIPGVCNPRLIGPNDPELSKVFLLTKSPDEAT